MSFVVPDKSQQKYVLGIDFGHGETSADICMIQWDEHYAQLKGSETIEIFNGVQSIPSVLLVKHTPNGDNYYIGNPAIAKYGNPVNYKDPSISFSFYSYFKKVPSAMTGNDKQVMLQFMREVYQQIKKQRQELTDTNHVVYIACPSNADVWTEDELTAYAQIASEAGLPLVKISNARTGLIRESRAAFIKACTDPETNSSVKEGILLIDFGSSTVDLTYYSSKCDKPIDDGGAYCGASQVEKLLYEELKRTNERIGKAFESNQSAETAMLHYIRQIKEEFYSFDAEQLELFISLTKATGGALRGILDEFYSNEEVKSILSSYIQKVSQCFSDYRDKYLKGRPIRMVFLTGGASRMDFIREIVCKVFSVKGEVIYRELNPSLTISKGIALTGRADLRTYAMEKQLLNSREIAGLDLATSTVKRAATEIADEMLKKVGDCYEAFANQSSDATIANLEQEIKGKIKSVSNSIILNEAFKIELKDITNERIIPHINGIVRDYFPDFSIPAIRSDQSFHIQIDSDDITTLSDIISDSVKMISDGMLAVLGKYILNRYLEGLGFIEAVLENILKFLLNIILNKDFEYADVEKRMRQFTLSYNDKQTELSASKRKSLSNLFLRNKDKYHSSICNAVEGILSKDKKLVSQINEVGRNEIKKYIIEQVNKARLNLN